MSASVPGHARVVIIGGGIGPGYVSDTLYEGAGRRIGAKAGLSPPL